MEKYYFQAQESLTWWNTW